MVEAVTRPILQAISPKNPEIVCFIQIFVPKMILLGLAVSFAPSLVVGYKAAETVEATAAVLSFLAWLILNDGFGEFDICYKRNMGVEEVIVYS